jgi:hypothetical protein
VAVIVFVIVPMTFLDFPRMQFSSKNRSPIGAPQTFMPKARKLPPLAGSIGTKGRVTILACRQGLLP